MTPAKASHKKSDEILMDPNDFKSIHLKISFTNSTTKTEIKNNARYFGGKKVSHKNDVLEVRLVEFMEQGLVLDLPAQSCASGHNVVIEIETENHSPPISFNTSAKVEDIQIGKEDKRERIQVRLVQFDEDSWRALKNLYSKRQEEILEFFKNVRGY